MVRYCIRVSTLDQKIDRQLTFAQAISLLLNRLIDFLSTRDLLNLVDFITSKKAFIKVLDLNIDTTSSIGKFFLTIIAVIAQLERGRHIYTFMERCDEDSSLTLGNGAVKIFLSTKGTIDDVSPELKHFLNYVDSGIVAGNFV